MSDERTDEQKQADQRLLDAIADVLHLYAADDETGWVLTEWVLVTSRQGFDDTGDACTSVEVIVDNTAPPPAHRQLGLLEFAAARYRRNFYIIESEGDS